jgi:hypothetical protein
MSTTHHCHIARVMPDTVMVSGLHAVDLLHAQILITDIMKYRITKLHKHHPNSATTGRICKVPRTTFRLQTKLERAHCKEKETNRLKSKRN